MSHQSKVEAEAQSWIESQLPASADNIEVHKLLTQMSELHQTRRWHQLTVSMEELLQLPAWHEGDFLIQLYQNFIKTFQTKLNFLKLAQMSLKISTQFKERNDAINFLNEQIALVDNDKQAQVFLKCHVGSMLLEQSRVKEVKQILEDAQKVMDETLGLDPSVNASFYKLSAARHKREQNAADFYKDMLLYLAYVPTDSLSIQQQREIACDLSISALVGETVFNFGELLSHPVFESLQNTPTAWIGDAVKSFNVGDINRYKSLVKDNEQDFNSIEIFAKKNQFMIEKITILALMESVFRMEAEKRVFTFQQVGSLTQLPENQVELLLMRALSLGLIKGSIDQVDGTVAIHWVQPRVLEMSQLSSMKTKLDEWKKKVDKMNTFLFTESPDLMSG